MNKNNKGITPIMYLAMMAIVFILVFILTVVKKNNNNEITPQNTIAPVSESTDSKTIKTELDQTMIDFPEDELQSLESELNSL